MLAPVTAVRYRGFRAGPPTIRSVDGGAHRQMGYLDAVHRRAITRNEQVSMRSQLSRFRTESPFDGSQAGSCTRHEAVQESRLHMDTSSPDTGRGTGDVAMTSKDHPVPPPNQGTDASSSAALTEGAQPTTDASTIQVTPSVAGSARQGNPQAAPRAWQVRHWTLWTTPARAVGYALAVEVAAALLCVVAVVTAAVPQAEDFVRFAVLAVALVVHVVVVWRGEERRRARAVGPIFDLTSVWTFAAVIVLPASLALLLIAGMRLATYPIRRRPWWRYLFGSAVLLASAAAAALFMRLFTALPLTSTTELTVQAGLVATVTGAALVYWVVQAAGHAGILTLTLGERLRDQWGSRGDNVAEAATLVVGGLLAVAMVFGVFYPLLVLLVLCPINLMLADHMADAAQLREHARTDARTGLLNSRGLREQAPRVLERCRTAGTPAAVLIIDLDLFKSINDTWGHPAGDAVLAATGETLRESVRPGDIAARDGGEEFVLVLPDTNRAAALGVANRIRLDIAALRVPTSEKDGNPIVVAERTASIGVAASPGNGTEFDELRRAADTALYSAKTQGRNRAQEAS
ncbi:MAG: diguanylate cyclase [Actinophytocola sp.]|nr:diguanylate cyclase [Actinophytocola sp.]